jgi:hypothetical protein
MSDMASDKFTLRIDTTSRARWEEAARREGFLKAGDVVNLAGWIKATCHRAALDQRSGADSNVPGMSQAPEGRSSLLS